MIATVTLNPALDETVYIDNLLVGDTNRVVRTEKDAGGKGINCSRMLRNLGAETVALGFIGGSTGSFIEHFLNQEGVPTDFVRVGNETRTNIQIQTLDGAPPTSLNEKGAPITKIELEKLVERVSAIASRRKFIVFGGSVPPNVPEDIYMRLVSCVESKGAQAVLDTEGYYMQEGILATPYMIKPNRSEAERLLGRKLQNDTDIQNAAKELHDKGIELVVISLGKEGAIAANGKGIWKAVPPPVEAISTVGSGDSMVAGIVYALAKDNDVEEALRLGSACGAATAKTPGITMGHLEDVQKLVVQVQITRLK